jgi:hypothetical protein
MIKYIIKLKDIPFTAKNEEEAEEIAIDIVNDINHDDGWELEKAEA